MSLPASSVIDGISANQAFSASAPGLGSVPSSANAALFNQPLWASPLVSSTGCRPPAASSSVTVGAVGQTAER